jgi:3-oxoacyl-[acyl-carrier protein] reductase
MSVAFVTGASRGLGAAIAESLAADGFAVAVGYHTDRDSATTVRDRIVAAGGRAVIVGADLRAAEQVSRAHDAVRAELGEVGTLVLNATGPQPEHAIDALTPAMMLDQFEHFVLGPLLLAQAVLPAMRARGHGRIIFVGSEVVDLAPPNTSAYTAAKAAQLGLVRCWARELGPDGITVNVVAPGFIPTDRHRDLPASAVDSYAATVPLGHVGTPPDVGAAVAYLASAGGRFVTGQRLAVNGGRTMT